MTTLAAISDQSTMPLWPAWVWAIGVTVLIAGWFLVGLCHAAAKNMPTPDEYEASPYGPMRRFNLNRLCELRGHKYGISSDGSEWDAVVSADAHPPVQDDIDTIENYANGGAA